MFDYAEELSYRSRFDHRGSPLQSSRNQHSSSHAFQGCVRNGLLQALPAEVLEELKPCLERIPLKRRQVLHERNLPVTHVYFIEKGLASLLARAGDQCTLEVGTLGHRDFVGLPVVLGTLRTPHRCMMQVSGEAFRMSAEDLQQAMGDMPALRQLLLSYVQASTVQSTQLVVCNTRHTLRQRLARWLLVADERIDGNEIALTHQFLGRALGVRRAGITTAMGQFEDSGLIHRGRGRISILDRSGLEAEACECCRAICSEYRRIFCDSVPQPPFGLPRQ